MQVIVNLPGQPTRLPLHVGALFAYFDYGLPVPNAVDASSAGSAAVSACAGWSETAFQRACNIIGGLTPKKIFVTPAAFKRDAGINGAALLALLGTTLLKDHKKRVALASGASLALLGSEVFAARDISHAPSLMDNGPLRRILLQELNFQEIFRSDIRINLHALEIGGSRDVWFSNRDDDNRDPEAKEHRERYVSKLLAAMCLAGWFRPELINGKYHVDGEYWGDFPLEHLLEQAGSGGRIIRFDYWEPIVGLRTPVNIWAAYLEWSFQISRDRFSQSLLAAFNRNSRGQRVFCIRTGKKLRTDIRSIQLLDFQSDDMKRNIDTGYRIMEENIPALKHYLNTGEVPDENAGI